MLAMQGDARLRHPAPASAATAAAAAVLLQPRLCLWAVHLTLQVEQAGRRAGRGKSTKAGKTALALVQLTYYQRAYYAWERQQHELITTRPNVE